MSKSFNSCFYSSFSYILPVIFSLVYGQYSILKCGLFLFSTSLLYHNYYYKLYFILDQIAIYNYFIYTLSTYFLYINYFSIYGLLYMLSTIYVFFTYIYGYKISHFSHYPNKKIGNYWHSSLHIIGSLGSCSHILAYYS